MAIRAITYSDEQWYVSQHDPDAKDEKGDIWPTKEEAIAAGATVFEWSAIPSGVMARINDQQQTTTVEVGEGMKQTFNMKTAARNRESFKWGVRRIWNFFDKKGNPVTLDFAQVLEGGEPFSVLAEKAINRFPLSIIQEVGSEIFNGNSLTETQRKNLEAALSHYDDLPSGSAVIASLSNAENGDAKDQPSRKVTNRRKAKKTTGPTP